MIVLDNDVAVKLLREDDSAVKSHLSQYSGEAWAIPSLVSFEFFQHYGELTVVAQTQRRLHDVFDEILPFTDDVAVEAWRLNDRLLAQEISLDILDLLNLATAHEAGATFITHNSNDFDKPSVYQLVDLDVIVS
ncbi:type II toxin-antitoxin system VapC family toxin [Halapricum hydrolyticum]|uniref:Type II toxin-antitoxin system VapC family toxin n=1 Tax=Halapricum hydrolyticum TaxID=2979991 RepID=A0AAE3IAZ2_9EURY|nr:type II toxin-antitoxin system VapC family toxin [Halapricum hydrolyticum]MCU4716597.1 type II toxin-antitoxin system VapC family toxin [Halapricum hydrolyticum]MCU4725798.1 type II toxin-antitoxin system VapC family toxin [Halapricum hydrolyticum]